MDAKEDFKTAEEPKVEEPKVEEPKVEEPKVEEPRLADIVKTIAEPYRLTPEKAKAVSLAVAEALKKTADVILVATEKNIGGDGGPRAQDIERAVREFNKQGLVKQELARQKQIGKVLDNIADEQRAVEEQKDRVLSIAGQLVLTILKTALVAV